MTINEFEGLVPKMAVNCRNLEVLDLGRNNFSTEFPHWLEHPHIIIVKATMNVDANFPTWKTKLPFPGLRVIDISILLVYCQNNNSKTFRLR